MLKGIKRGSNGEIQFYGSKICVVVRQNKQDKEQMVAVQKLGEKGNNLLFMADNNVWCVSQKENSYQKLFI